MTKERKVLLVSFDWELHDPELSDSPDTPMDKVLETSYLSLDYVELVTLFFRQSPRAGPWRVAANQASSFPKRRWFRTGT